MRKTLKWTVASLAAIFLLLQFTNPARTNPPVIRDLIATLNAPPAVAADLRAACYDCHSHETKWPFYAHIAPASWLVASDVNKGRNNLDLSDWPDDPAREVRRLDDMNEEVDNHEMPPKKYTMLHPEARLTEEQRKQIMDWTDAADKRLHDSSTNQ